MSRTIYIVDDDDAVRAREADAAAREAAGPWAAHSVAFRSEALRRFGD